MNPDPNKEKEEEEYFDVEYNLILAGDSKVGKTAMIKRFTYAIFRDEIKSTIELAKDDKIIKLDNGLKCKLILYEANNSTFLLDFFKEINLNEETKKKRFGILLTYDVTNGNSFSNIDNWIEDIKKINIGNKTYLSSNNWIPFLIGNKWDKESYRVVSTEDGEAKAKKIGAEFYECSAKADYQIEETFLSIGNILNKTSLGEIEDINRKFLGASHKPKKKEVEEGKGKIYKILLVGASSSGKTSLLSRYIENTFTSMTASTTGLDYMVKKYKINGFPFTVHFLDTAGQERFSSITKNLFQSVQGIMILYDITDLSSFADVPNWIKSIKETAPENVVLSLIGSKLDLEEQRAISTQIGMKKAEEYKIPFYECSAKECINVGRIFTEIVNRVHETNRAIVPITHTVLISSYHEEKKRGFKC